MVLIRRKSDGKYFANKNGSRSWDRQGKVTNWIDDPSKCKPYAHEAGARWSFYSVSYVQVNRKDCPHFKLSDYEFQGKRYKYYSKSCVCVKKARAEGKAKFDAKYEIVPVSVKVVVGQ